MIDTSLICGLGVMPFVFGVFMPTVKFALLLMIMLMTALLGDLILLPAILAGPAGKLFRLDKSREHERPKRPGKSDPQPDDYPDDDDEDSGFELEDLYHRRNVSQLGVDSLAERLTDRLDKPEAKLVSDPTKPLSDQNTGPVKPFRRI